MRTNNETNGGQGDREMKEHPGIYAGHLRIGDLDVRHFAMIDDVAGEGVLVTGHVHAQE